jgi:hypothetical protein
MILNALKIGSQAYVQVRAEANETSLSDSILKKLDIVSPGVVQVQQKSGVLNDNTTSTTFSFEIPSTAVEGTANLSVTVAPQTFQDLFTLFKSAYPYDGTSCPMCLTGTLYTKALELDQDPSQS